MSPHMNESCHTYGWVMLHRWMSHVSHMTESSHKYESKLRLHTCVRHDSFIRVTWRIRTCDRTRAYVMHHPFTCVPFHTFIHMWMCAFSHIHTHVNVCLWRCAVSQAYMRHEWWLIYMCALSQAHMRHDSLICATRLIDMYNTTYWYVRQDSFICAIKLIQMCDTTHSYVWHDSFVCATWFNHVRDMT